MDDPAAQEKIRRGHHEYVPGDGKHGTYVEKPYFHKEYPKIMDLTPSPNRADYDNDAEHEHDVRKWEAKVLKSTVNSKEEEDAYLARRGANLNTARKGGAAMAQKSKEIREARALEAIKSSTRTRIKSRGKLGARAGATV